MPTADNISSHQYRTSFNPEGGAAAVNSKSLINSWLNDRRSMESFGSVPISLSQQSLGPRRQSWLNLMDSEETLGKRNSVSMAMLPSVITESDGGGGLTSLSAIGKRRNPSGASKTSQPLLQHPQDEFLLMVRKNLIFKLQSWLQTSCKHIRCKHTGQKSMGSFNF